jgi:hypothetical protein
VSINDETDVIPFVSVAVTSMLYEFILPGNDVETENV